MIENHVVSQNLAKQLKEAGVPQESEFYWVHCWDSIKYKHTWMLFYGRDNSDQVNEHISAYLSSELGEWLPAGFCQTDKCPKQEGIKIWAIYYAGVKGMETDNLEVNSRAKMLLYLINQGLVKFGERK